MTGLQIVGLNLTDNLLETSSSINFNKNLFTPYNSLANLATTQRIILELRLNIQMNLHNPICNICTITDPMIFNYQITQLSLPDGNTIQLGTTLA